MAVTPFDEIVIGAGTNGLAAAAVLARRGRRVLVLERREQAGGTNATEEFHPGFRANACRDDAGWMPRGLARACGIDGRAFSATTAPVGLVAAGGDGPIALAPDPATASAALRRHSRRDAERWGAFVRLVRQAAGVLEGMYGAPPPDVHGPLPPLLRALVSSGRRLRALGRDGMLEVLRAYPMPVADLLDEWFTAPALSAALATLGIRDLMHGPLASGTAFNLLHQQVGAPEGHIGVRRVVRGGTGALPLALASAAARTGATMRFQAEVDRVLVRDGVVEGVRLASGEEIHAGRVVSSADPRRTFGLVDPGWLDPDLLSAVDHIRMRGSTARVHFALDALPDFGGGAAEAPVWLGGTVVMADDVLQLERSCDEARFGEVPADPAITFTVPSLADPSMAPPGRHVLSATVHHVPYARRVAWDAAARDALAALVEERVSRLAPDFRERILERWILAPPDIEARYGVTEGSLSHGELALDQVLFMRPVPRCARYATPLPGLWLCGAGTHPASHAGACGLLGAGGIMSS